MMLSDLGCEPPIRLGIRLHVADVAHQWTVSRKVAAQPRHKVIQCQILRLCGAAEQAYGLHECYDRDNPVGIDTATALAELNCVGVGEIDGIISACAEPFLD